MSRFSPDRREAFLGLAAFTSAPTWPSLARAQGVLAKVEPPPAVHDMLARIHEACAADSLEALRIPIERNELPPVFERGARRDPLALLAARSADGEGHEMLRILARALDGGVTALKAGAAPVQYLWPRFGWTSWVAMNADERSQAWGLVRVAEIGASTLAREALFHTVQIGADGTWHSFTDRPPLAGTETEQKPASRVQATHRKER